MQNTVLEALRHESATRDEVVKAEHSLAMAAEFARYTLEDYAHRPDIADLLDALTTYQAAQTAREAAGTAREAAGTALIDALTKALDHRGTPTTK